MDLWLWGPEARQNITKENGSLELELQGGSTVVPDVHLKDTTPVIQGSLVRPHLLKLTLAVTPFTAWIWGTFTVPNTTPGD